MSYRIIIAGTSDFNDLPLLTRECDSFLAPFIHLGIEVISGKQRLWSDRYGCFIGGDLTGELYANMRDYPVKPFPADWDRYRPADPTRKNPAGPIRNRAMGDYAKAGPDGGGLIDFWDGKSRGSKNMIEYAISIGLPVKVVNY